MLEKVECSHVATISSHSVSGPFAYTVRRGQEKRETHTHTHTWRQTIQTRQQMEAHARAHNWRILTYTLCTVHPRMIMIHNQSRV